MMFTDVSFWAQKSGAARGDGESHCSSILEKKSHIEFPYKELTFESWMLTSFWNDWRVLLFSKVNWDIMYVVCIFHTSHKYFTKKYCFFQNWRMPGAWQRMEHMVRFINLCSCLPKKLDKGYKVAKIWRTTDRQTINFQAHLGKKKRNTWERG